MNKFMKDVETRVGLQRDRGEDSSVCVSLVKLHASHSDVVLCFGFCISGSLLPKLWDCMKLELNGDVIIIFLDQPPHCAGGETEAQ